MNDFDSYHSQQQIDLLRQPCVIVRVCIGGGSELLKQQHQQSNSRAFFHTFDGKITFSCSGFIIDKERGLIATTSSIFLSFYNSLKSSASAANITTQQLQSNILNDILIDVMLHSDTNVKLSENNNKNLSNSNKINVNNSSSSTPSTITIPSTSQSQTPTRVYDPLIEWRKCKLVKIIPCNQSLVDVLTQLKSHFVLPNYNSSVSNYNLDRSFGIAILQLLDTSSYDNSLIRPVTIGNSIQEKTGNQLTVVGSPFGFISPTIFLNSLSTGVICNCIPSPGSYSTPSLFLTDARCLPGNEGGGVFNRDGLLIGIVAPPIKSKDEKSPFTLTPVIPIHCFLPQLEKTNLQPTSFSLQNSSASNSNLKRSKNTIVLVKFKDTWGSGVLISDTGYLLTNAHLLIPSIPTINTIVTTTSLQSPSFSQSMFKDFKVDLRVNNGAIIGREDIDGSEWYSGSIEYISHTHLDIALIKIIQPSSKLLFHHVLYEPLLNPKHGTEIAVLGYPLIPPTHNPPLSLTKGIISNIVYVDGNAVSYQTTAPVHSGNSGGGLFDMNGNFLGIVTCNAKQKNGSIITDLNFSIPSISLIHFFNYATGQDSHSLDVMRHTTTNKFLKALWKLQITSSPPGSNIQPGGKKYNEFISKISKNPNQFQQQQQLQTRLQNNQDLENMNLFHSKL
eukprot:gene5989-7461_t